MRVHLLYFGVLKDLFATSSDTLDLPEAATVATLLDRLQQTQISSSNKVQMWSSLAVAVNRVYAQPTTILCEGDEVALLPPVSGGAQDFEGFR